MSRQRTGGLDLKGPEAQGATEVLAGRFELHEVIGGGGMAIVYRAWDRAQLRPCAVKVLADVLSRDEEFRLRFGQEARAAWGLTHPHIVRVYDWGESGPHHYIVMEYVAGGTLRGLLNQHGRLPETTAAQLASEVADALAYAHAHGVIHRDIKPQNILLTEDGTVKVADFGIARTLDAPTLTRTGSVMGSAQYLSPEQARGDPAGPSSDLYALGVMLFEMLAGRVPFEGDSAVSIALKHLGEPPPDLARIRPGVSKSTAAIVAQLLVKADGNRYPSASALAADLRHIACASSKHQQGRPGAGGILSAPAPWSRLATERIPQPPFETALLLGASDPRASAPRRPGAASKSKTAVFPAMRGHVVRADGGQGPSRWAVRLRKGVAAALLTLAVMGTAVWPTAEENGINVPPLVGRTVAAASEAAKALELHVVVAGYRQDSNVMAGTILAQDPAPGQRMNKGSSLKVILNQGSGLVPDLQGLLVSAATSRLAAAGLRLGRVIESYGMGSETTGKVIFQFQSAGTQLEPDAPVDVIVSKGPN